MIIENYLFGSLIHFSPKNIYKRIGFEKYKRLLRRKNMREDILKRIEEKNSRVSYKVGYSCVLRVL